MNPMNRAGAWIVSVVAMLSYIVLPANADDSGLERILKRFPAYHLLKWNVYELDETAYAGSVYMQSVSAGSNVSPSKAVDHKPLKRPLTEIQVNYFEKGTLALRGDRKLQKIKEVQTAD